MQQRKSRVSRCSGFSRTGIAVESRKARFFVYAAGGYYYPGKDLNGLRDEMASYLDLGYSVVKIKIGGASLAEDIERIEAVLKILETPDQAGCGC